MLKILGHAWLHKKSVHTHEFRKLIVQSFEYKTSWSLRYDKILDCFKKKKKKNMNFYLVFIFICLEAFEASQFYFFLPLKISFKFMKLWDEINLVDTSCPFRKGTSILKPQTGHTSIVFKYYVCYLRESDLKYTQYPLDTILEFKRAKCPCVFLGSPQTFYFYSTCFAFK